MIGSREFDPCQDIGQFADTIDVYLVRLCRQIGAREHDEAFETLARMRMAINHALQPGHVDCGQPVDMASLLEDCIAENDAALAGQVQEPSRIEILARREKRRRHEQRGE
jgi:hypothetical protein